MNPVRLEYVYGPGQMPWTEFKQLNGVVDAALFGIDNSIREATLKIISSHPKKERQESPIHETGLSEELSDLTEAVSEFHEGQNTLGLRAIDALENIEGHLPRIRETLEEVGRGVAKVSSSVDRLTGTVIVAFALGAAGGFFLWKSICAINDAVRNPEKSWADEQFRIAEEHSKRGENRLALQSVRLAIHGNSNHTGYQLDYKYHFCAGEILMGKGENFDPSLVNLEEAENEFLKAESYVPKKEKETRALALLHASFAAYANGRSKNARDYAAKARDFQPKDALILYHSAKYEAHVGDLEAAKVFLVKTLITDWSFSTRAANDGDFLKHGEWLKAILIEVIEPMRLQAVNASKRLLEIIATIEKYLMDIDALKSSMNILDAGRLLWGDLHAYKVMCEAHEAANGIFQSGWRQRLQQGAVALGKELEEADRLISTGTMETIVKANRLLNAARNAYRELSGAVKNSFDSSTGAVKRRIQTLSAEVDLWLERQNNMYALSNEKHDSEQTKMAKEFHKVLRGVYDVLRHIAGLISELPVVEKSQGK